ncbi:MAG: hypothetical protein K2K04_03220 [Clostridia bacterium]|nr:hypothetical protein [Clostridia bacterium]
MKADISFYVGGYGAFDFQALKACQTFKRTHPDTKIYFITPYLDETFLQTRNIQRNKFDGVIFPPIEKVPKKYAIIERNKWMVSQSDFVIAYVNHSWGGAAKTFDYAFKTKKQYINLGIYDPYFNTLQKSRV